MSKRIRLTTATTSALNALASFGPGGATARQVASKCRLRPRQTGARLRWLKLVGFVRYVPDKELWQLTDDSMFKEQSCNPSAST